LIFKRCPKCVKGTPHTEKKVCEVCNPPKTTPSALPPELFEPLEKPDPPKKATRKKKPR